MGLRQERFASESCRSTSGPDVVDDNYIRPARHRDRPEARRACDRSSCGTRSGRTRRAQCDESARLIIERQHPIVEDLGRGDRRLAVIEFGEGDLGIGIDEGLLIDPPDALQGTDIKCVLGSAIAGALAFELAMSALALSSAAICASV